MGIGDLISSVVRGPGPKGAKGDPGAQALQLNGAPLQARKYLNVIAPAGTLADNPGNNSIDYTPPAGGGGNTTQYDVTPSPTSGNVNNLVIPAGQQYVRLVGLTGDITITGFSDSTPIPSGQTLTRVITLGQPSYKATIQFLNAGSLPANQIESGRPGASAQAYPVLAPGSEFIIQRNSTGANWRLISSGWTYRRGIDVRDYGAEPTGFLDSTAAFQNAINACGGSFETLYVPPGTYKISQPLWIKQVYTKIQGADGTAITGCILRGTHCGPITYLAPTFAAKVRCDVVSNVTYAHIYGPVTPPSGCAQNPYINFRDKYLGSLHGLAAFTIEFNCIINGGAVASANPIIVSYGAKSSSSAPTSGISITADAPSPFTLHVGLTTTGGSASITASNAIADSLPHAIAVSYSSADGFVRLYVDGIYKGHGAATGTVVQNWFENFLLGTKCGLCHESGTTTQFGDIQIGNIRFSSTARYRSEAGGTTYTPPTSSNLAYDSSTLLLMQFDTANHFANDQMVVCQSNGAGSSYGPPTGVYYQWKGVGSVANFDGTANIAIDNLSMYSLYDTCISGELATKCDFRRLNLLGVQCITMFNNSYYGTIDQCIITGVLAGLSSYGNWRGHGIGLFNVSGLWNIRSVSSGTTYGWSVILNGASQCKLDTVLINTADGPGVFYIDGFAQTLVNCGGGDESGTGITDSAVILNGVENLSWRGGGITCLTASYQNCVLIDGGSNINISGDFCSTNPVVHFASPTADMVDVAGSTQLVTLGAAYAPAPLAMTIQWSDGSGPLKLSEQELHGWTFVNFTADADKTLAFNDFICGGTLTLTDTGGVLTANRNLILPMCAGIAEAYNRTIRNRTTKTITVKGAINGSIAVPTNTTVEVAGIMMAATGTVSVNGSLNGLVGVGTAFTTQLQVGETIYLYTATGLVNGYKISSITDDTHLSVSPQTITVAGSGVQLWIQNWIAV